MKESPAEEQYIDEPDWQAAAEDQQEAQFFDSLADKYIRQRRAAHQRLGLDKDGSELPASIAEDDPPLSKDGRVSIAVYRRLARQSSSLTAGEYRTLDALLSFADARPVAFANCFPSRKKIAKRYRDHYTSSIGRYSALPLQCRRSRPRFARPRPSATLRTDKGKINSGTGHKGA